MRFQYLKICTNIFRYFLHRLLLPTQSVQATNVRCVRLPLFLINIASSGGTGKPGCDIRQPRPSGIYLIIYCISHIIMVQEITSQITKYNLTVLAVLFTFTSFYTITASYLV